MIVLWSGSGEKHFFLQLNHIQSCEELLMSYTQGLRKAHADTENGDGKQSEKRGQGISVDEFSAVCKVFA